MSNESQDVLILLGELKADVRNLRRDIQEDVAKAQKISDAAAASRSTLYQSVESVGQRVKAIETDVGHLKKEMSSMKVVTDQVTQWRLAGMGALAVTGVAASSIAWGVMHYWDKIVAYFLAR